MPAQPPLPKLLSKLKGPLSFPLQADHAFHEEHEGTDMRLGDAFQAHLPDFYGPLEMLGGRQALLVLCCLCLCCAAERRIPYAASLAHPCGFNSPAPCCL